MPAPQPRARYIYAPSSGRARCGALIIVGLFTRAATIPLIITMLVALVSTKLPILLGHGFGPFSLPDLKRYAFWSAQHEARADLTMLLGCVYLLIVGSGRWSIDRVLDRDARRANHQL
ncbi:DoxX family protein [Rhizorhapis sp. SPR117]|uniref:DoxX family protein n=1 Tax=Rhizorhapis sp. SPR117 TaxID=2912611 RepID=UPI00403E5005